MDIGQPEVEMRVGTTSTKLEDGFYNCDVTVTVTAKLEENKVMFLWRLPR